MRGSKQLVGRDSTISPRLDSDVASVQRECPVRTVARIETLFASPEWAFGEFRMRLRDQNEASIAPRRTRSRRRRGNRHPIDRRSPKHSI